MAPTPPSRDDDKHAETKVAEDAARLQLAIDSAALGIYEWDVGASESRWDDRVYELWGATPGTPATFDLILAGVHPDDRESVKANLAAMIDNPDFRTESRIIGIENGVERSVELTHKVLYEDGVPRRVIGTVRDVTRERAQQREIERLTRLYAALTHVNQAIVRAETQERLLADVCLALVQQGGFRFAWIARRDGSDLRLLASSADPGTMIADLHECAATAAVDCCPTMAALRDGATSLCNDVRSGSTSGGWR
ncbi:MAG: PAS domain-containing protein, partial [Thermoanaerobaculia bacterium]